MLAFCFSVTLISHLATGQDLGPGLNSLMASDAQPMPQQAPQASPSASVNSGGMSSVAVGMAGQVASVMVDKVTDNVEKKMNSDSNVMPCVGPHCCRGSSCMNLPGLRCSADRGPTRCVGASNFPPKKGQCGCLVGACSPEGKCSSQGLSDSFGAQPTQAAQAPQQPPAQQAHPAPQPEAAGEAGQFSQWHGQGTAASEDQFNTWHTASRLYADGEVAAGRVQPEDLRLSLLAYGGAVVSFFVGFAVVCARVGRGLLERRSAAQEEECLVDSEQKSLKGDWDAHEA